MSIKKESDIIADEDDSYLDTVVPDEEEQRLMQEELDEYYNTPEYLRRELRTAQWQRLEKYWDNTFHYNIVGNYELKSIFFHTLLGALLPTICRKEGRTISPRIHVFAIQRSGTGKTVSMKLLANTFKRIVGNEKVNYFLQTTEAALVGTFETDPKTKIMLPHYGALFEQIAIFFDEGRVLFNKSNQHAQTILEALQMATDEPGMIEKGLRLGIIKYQTPTTIIAGSTKTDEISAAILTRGFFQRFYLHYNVITDTEKDEMQKERMKLQEISNTSREAALTKFIQLVQEVVRNAPTEIEIHTESYQYFFNEWNAYTKQFRGTYNVAAQDALESFIDRIDEMLIKIACIFAVCSGKPMIDYNSFVWARKYGERQIENAMKLLDEIDIKQNSISQKRENLILHLVEQTPGISKNQLIKKLAILNKIDKWPFAGAWKNHKEIDKLIKLCLLEIRIENNKLHTLYISKQKD